MTQERAGSSRHAGLISGRSIAVLALCWGMPVGIAYRKSGPMRVALVAGRVRSSSKERLHLGEGARNRAHRGGCCSRVEMAGAVCTERNQPAHPHHTGDPERDSKPDSQALASAMTPTSNGAAEEPDPISHVTTVNPVPGACREADRLVNGGGISVATTSPQPRNPAIVPGTLERQRAPIRRRRRNRLPGHRCSPNRSHPVADSLRWNT